MEILEKNNTTASGRLGKLIAAYSPVCKTITILTVRAHGIRDGVRKRSEIVRQYAVSLLDGSLCTPLTAAASRLYKLGRLDIAARVFPSGIVCVRSFFGSSVVTHARKIRRRWIVASASLCAALVLSAALVNSLFCFGLFLDGEVVGKMVSITEMETIVTNAEEQLTELLGYECSVDYALSLAVAAETAPASTEDIEKAIIASVDGVEEKYVLKVDGEVIGAANEKEPLTDILNEVMDMYTSEATDSARFVSDVTVERSFVTEDVVSDPEILKTILEPGNDESEFRLAVENVESVLISEEIPFEVEYIEDDTLYEGENIVLCEGESGAALVTERSVLLNGIEQSRTQLGRVITKEPVTEVVAVGTRPATASSGSYIWPAEGIITAGFGYRSTSVGNSNHKGLDIAGRSGQSIYAADGGEVIFSGWSGGYGNFIKIQHDNGDVTCYGHNSKLLVSTGDKVRQGQEIALMGSTGVSSGVHCHFEIRIGGVPVNPSTFLS